MRFSRRTLLRNVGGAAAAQTPLLRLSGIFTSPLAQVPMVAIPVTEIQSMVTVFVGASMKFSPWLPRLTYAENSPFEGSDPWGIFDSTGDAMHRAVTDHLNGNLPPLFAAINQIRGIKSKIMNGDEQHDNRVMDVFRAAAKIKKKFYQDEHSALLEKIGDEPLIKIMVTSDDKSLRRCESSLGLLLDIYGKIAGEAFEAASQARQEAAYSAIRQLGQPIGISAETMEGLMKFGPSMTQAWFGNDEFFDFFDDRKLFERAAEIAQDHATGILWDFQSRQSCLHWNDQDHRLNLDSENEHLGWNQEYSSFERDHYDRVYGPMDRFRTIVHELYGRHFSAALPDVLDFPLPQFDKIFSHILPATELETIETSVEQTDPVAAEEASVESSAEASADLTPSLRLLGSNLLKSPGAETETGEATATAPLDTIRSDNDRAIVPEITAPELAL